MITTVNFHHLTQLQIFCLALRVFKIYSSSNFQICNTVSLTIVAVLYVTSQELTYRITGSLYLLTALTLFPHSTISLSNARCLEISLFQHLRLSRRSPGL